MWFVGSARTFTAQRSTCPSQHFAGDFVSEYFDPSAAAQPRTQPTEMRGCWRDQISVIRFTCPQVWWCVRYNTLENILLRCEFWNDKILVLVELSFQNEMNNLSRLTVYSLTSINLACKSHTSLCFKPCLKGFVFLMCHNSSLSKYMFMLIYSPPFHPRFICF